LKRLIQHDVETPLSKLLIKGELKDGDAVTVDCKDGQVVIVPMIGG
jgi:ATP-dependent Clp protease ATP-binding subunit ClpB